MINILDSLGRFRQCVFTSAGMKQGSATPCSIKISIDLLMVYREIYKRVSTGMGGNFAPHTSAADEIFLTLAELTANALSYYETNCFFGLARPLPASPLMRRWRRLDDQVIQFRF